MNSISRRKFILGCGGMCLWAGLAVPGNSMPGIAQASSKRGAKTVGRVHIFRGDAPDEPWKFSKEAFSYEKSGTTTICSICPNHCVLSPGDRSICRSKVNIDGKLYSLAYGNPCAVHVDPVEKKPLFHFLPKSRAFSLAATGCNFRCLNCQNWEISQVRPKDVRAYELFPKQAVEHAQRSGAESIAYTYSEPITFLEYTLETAQTAGKKGIKNLLISNGYINREPLLKLCKAVDAANINLKSFDDKIYRKLNGGTLKPVLETLKTLAEQNVHLEITTLVVPDYVDDPAMIRSMCKWIAKNLGVNHPLHFLRFFPHYKLDRLPPTPVPVLENMRTIAMEEGIRYVYIGNVPGHEANHTWCHSCGELLIERHGYEISVPGLSNGKCSACNAEIPGIWNRDEA
ncbi:MAG: AmmeMemoRadiSam system radical SAM enzyme [Desulfobacteraceae bacterium]|nr:AmmeMemoRadiSam system radical SAM enzyme [Desulfobacteraceae bacterium]